MKKQSLIALAIIIILAILLIAYTNVFGGVFTRQKNPYYTDPPKIDSSINGDFKSFKYLGTIARKSQGVYIFLETDKDIEITQVTINGDTNIGILRMETICSLNPNPEPSNPCSIKKGEWMRIYNINLCESGGLLDLNIFIEYKSKFLGLFTTTKTEIGKVTGNCDQN